MGFFNAVQKTKLRGEIALLDREIKARQNEFGIELYDLLIVLARSKSTFGPIKTPSVFHAIETSLKEPFEACHADIQQLKDQKDAKEQEVVHLEVNRERAPPARTNREALGKAGSWISDTSSEAKLAVQIKLLERQIQSRKEQFGIDVFVILDNNEDKKTGNRLSSPKKGIASRLSKLSNSEQEIEDCVDRAKKDVSSIRRRQQDKEREIEYLDNN